MTLYPIFGITFQGVSDPEAKRKVLAQVATRIANQVRGINRVVYDITSKPPGTIEWE